MAGRARHARWREKRPQLRAGVPGHFFGDISSLLEIATMDQRDQELLEKQLRAINPAPRQYGVIIVTLLVGFLAGMNSWRLPRWSHKRADARSFQRCGAHCLSEHRVCAPTPVAWAARGHLRVVRFSSSPAASPAAWRCAGPRHKFCRYYPHSRPYFASKDGRN